MRDERTTEERDAERFARLPKWAQDQLRQVAILPHPQEK